MRGWSWLGRAGHSVTDGSAVQFPAATVLGQETDPSFATQQAWQRLSLRFTSQAPNLPQVGTELRNHSGRKKCVILSLQTDHRLDLSMEK